MTEHEMFEKWAKSNMFCIEKWPDSDRYESIATQFCWMAFKSSGVFRESIANEGEKT